ncbi:MAG: alpha-ketoglutarate-dependent dioxygenase AlkB, partial [Aquihabitans sp.]
MLQYSLLASATTPSIDPKATPLPRRDLGAGAWLDITQGWVQGSDALFEHVHETAPWSAHERIMWGKVIEEPRLSTRGWTDAPSPVPELGRALSLRYGLDLRSVNANWYRNGQDSVAWHGDNSGRVADTT